MIILLAIFSLIYSILLLILRFIIKKDTIKFLEKSEPFTIILVTNRGIEKEYLKSLVGYEKDFEILIGFDRCDDLIVGNAIDVLEELELNYRIFEYNKIPIDWKSSKKYVLHNLVRESKYNKILTLDDDTFVSDGYLEYVSKIDLTVDKYVIGFVKPFSKRKNLFSRVEFIDYIGFNLLSIALVKLGIVAYSNANNQIFDKDTIIEAEPFKKSRHLLSGDDTFAMLEMNKIATVNSFYDEQAYTNTEILGSLTKFIKQRLRWVSKQDQNKNYNVLIFSIYSYIYYLILFIMSIYNFDFFIISLFIKTLVDFIFILSAKKHFSFINILLLPIVEIFQIIYVVIISPIGIIFKPKKWI